MLPNGIVKCHGGLPFERSINVLFFPLYKRARRLSYAYLAICEVGDFIDENFSHYT